MLPTTDAEPFCTADLAEAITYAEDQDGRTATVAVDPRRLTLKPRGALYEGRGSTGTHLLCRQVSPSFLSRLNLGLRIPSAFAARLPAPTYARVVNDLLSRQGRTRTLLVIRDHVAIGLASMRYTYVPNSDVLRLAQDTQPEAREAGTRITFSDHVMRATLVTPRTEQYRAQLADLQAAHGKNHPLVPGATDVSHYGIDVVNSVTGFASLSATGFLYRPICTNGVVLGTRIGGSRQRHADATAADLLAQLGDSLDQLRNVRVNFRVLGRDATVDEVRTLCRRMQELASKPVAEKLLAGSLRAVEAGAPVTRFQLVQRLTDARALQALPPLTRRNVEALAGTLFAADGPA